MKSDGIFSRDWYFRAKTQCSTAGCLFGPSYCEAVP